MFFKKHMVACLKIPHARSLCLWCKICAFLYMQTTCLSMFPLWPCTSHGHLELLLQNAKKPFMASLGDASICNSRVATVVGHETKYGDHAHNIYAVVMTCPFCFVCYHALTLDRLDVLSTNQCLGSIAACHLFSWMQPLWYNLCRSEAAYTPQKQKRCAHHDYHGRLCL